MHDDSSMPDDSGTVLDSYARPPASRPAAFVAPPAVSRSTAPPAARAPEEVLYKSVYRWTAPRILICDDGSLDDGETVYVRSDKIVIGRSKGEIVIGHDVAMSGSHAEISRRGAGGTHVWKLRDLDSSNGTFVRVRSATLKPGTTLQLGGKRYKFKVPTPGAAEENADVEPTTMVLGKRGSLAVKALPMLVETSSTGDEPAFQYPLRSQRIAIGRPGYGNDIEIDDPCLAGIHAVVSRDASGVWQLESQQSLNGVWVKVGSVTLTTNCLFQCGEQRFRFMP